MKSSPNLEKYKTFKRLNKQILKIATPSTNPDNYSDLVDILEAIDWDLKNSFMPPIGVGGGAGGGHGIYKPSTDSKKEGYSFIWCYTCNDSVHAEEHNPVHDTKGRSLRTKPEDSWEKGILSAMVLYAEGKEPKKQVEYVLNLVSKIIEDLEIEHQKELKRTVKEEVSQERKKVIREIEEGFHLRVGLSSSNSIPVSRAIDWLEDSINSLKKEAE